jgi:ribosomal protein S12 methylthiotransferase accessory factor
MRMEMQIVFPGGAQVDAITENGMVITTNQDGSAPAPFSLFLASMGTCAGIYVLSFCQQRGLPTEGLRIVQRMELNPISRLVDHVELDIQLPPGFPEQYRAAVVRSAELCAVKKHLENPPAFDVHTSVLSTESQN